MQINRLPLTPGRDSFLVKTVWIEIGPDVFALSKVSVIAIGTV